MNQTTTECSKFMMAEVAEERPKCGKFCCEVDLPGMFRLVCLGLCSHSCVIPKRPLGLN